MAAVFPEAAAGADDALELLYRDHAQEVSRYALAVLGDRSDAEDVTQTTFLNAFRALQRGERPRRPDHWLIAIAHNACRERLRNGQRRPREVAFVEEVSAASVRDDDGPTANELRGALLQLPVSQRTALVMRELEGRPYAEIAQALKISSGAVETLLFRARQALREQLEEQLLCRDAVAAITRQAEGRLTRGERAGLRAHLRYCSECSHVARSRRARRTVLGGFLPVPSWLTSLFGSGGAGAVGLAAKAAAIVVALVAVGGGVSAGATHSSWPHRHLRAAPVAIAVRAAHGPTSLPAAHVPVLIAGTDVRSTPVGLQASPSGRADNVPGESTVTVPTPQGPTQFGPTVGAGTSVAQVPAGPAQSGASAPGNAHGAGSSGKPAAGAGAAASTDGKGVAGAQGNSAKAKAAAAQAKKNQQPAAAAGKKPKPTTQKSDPPAAAAGPAQPNGQANGQGNGQANGQGNGQANGQGNGQGNGQANGQGNGQANGQGNGQANGQGNGQANGQGNGQANGQGNASAAAPPAGPATSVPAQANAGGNGHH